VSEIECRVLNDVLPPNAATAGSLVVVVVVIVSVVDAEPRQSLFPALSASEAAPLPHPPRVNGSWSTINWRWLAMKGAAGVRAPGSGGVVLLCQCQEGCAMISRTVSQCINISMRLVDDCSCRV